MKMLSTEVFPSVLTLILTFGFFGLIAALFFHEAPQANREVLLLTVGTIGGAWASCVAYYVGASKGDQKPAPTAVTTTTESRTVTESVSPKSSTTSAS